MCKFGSAAKFIKAAGDAGKFAVNLWRGAKFGRFGQAVNFWGILKIGLYERIVV